MKKNIITMCLKLLVIFLFIHNVLIISSEGSNEILRVYHGENPWRYVSFDESMQKKRYSQAIKVTEKIIGIDGEVLYSFFRNLYEQNSLAQINPSKDLKIPKIIHQIWLGSAVPEVFERYMNSWVKQHLGRDWRYKLWTDTDVANIELDNQIFYDATDNYGVKSDILRWEIAYRYGGVYVDMDFECLQSLDIFHYTYDFYTALQPLDTLFVQLGAALFGARPGHPILKQCIKTIRDDWNKKGVPQRTGPIHFTKSFYTAADKAGNIDIALPASYFYPFGSRDSNINRQQWKKDGSFAVHWWAKSWMPKNYRPQLFKAIENNESVQNWND